MSWQALAYQPYFSFTASNVGYGFWSHDLGFFFFLDIVTQNICLFFKFSYLPVFLSEGPRDDQELYVRWVQWVAFSAVFRSHDRGFFFFSSSHENHHLPSHKPNNQKKKKSGMAIGSCADQDPITCSIIKPWDTDPYHFEIIRNAMNERARLVPYLYQGWREAYDTGVSLLRPMYYEVREKKMRECVWERMSFV